MKTGTTLWVILTGLLVGAACYWPVPYAEINLLELYPWLLASSAALAGALLFTMFLSQKPWKIALSMTLGVVLAILIRIIYDTTFRDATSHNLAPFELIIVGLQTLPAAFAGAYLGLLFKKLKK